MLTWPATRRRSAVRIVRRRPDVVLRDEGLEHLRLRSPEGQARRNARALQGEEHGRRAVRARGVPKDVRDLSVSRDAGPWHEHSAAH